MRPLGADIIQLEHPVPRHLPLDREVPHLILRVVVLPEVRSGVQAEKCQRIPAWRISQPHRPRVVERGELREISVAAPLDTGIHQAKGRSHFALDCVTGRGIEETISRADRRLVVQSIREPDARLNVVIVAVERALVGVIDELHYAIQVGIYRLHLVADRRRRADVKPVETVEPVRPRNVEVVAKAHIQRQLLVDLDVVMPVEMPVVGGSAEPVRREIAARINRTGFPPQHSDERSGSNRLR